MDATLLLQRYNTLLEEVGNCKERYNVNQNVSIIAVTKYSDIETVKNFVSLNLNIALAESRAQSLRDRASLLTNINWHFIGRIQSNKLKYIIEHASLIHSVDSIETLFHINEYAQKHGKIQDVLIQLNISDEEQKGGVALESTSEFFDKASECSSVNIVGLMGMAEYTDDESIIERQFESLKIKQGVLSQQYTNLDLRELSMGMTGDYRLAIKHGSTMIRVGSLLFG